MANVLDHPDGPAGSRRLGFLLRLIRLDGFSLNFGPALSFLGIAEQRLLDTLRLAEAGRLGGQRPMRLDAV